MADYVDQIYDKKYISNTVILINGVYYCARQPDTGLAVAAPYDKMIVGPPILNPAQIDIRKVNTTIATYSFKLLDKNEIVSTLVNGSGAALVGQNVTIWIGRSRRNATFEANDFAGYYQLPITRIKKIEHVDNTYTFTTTEDTDKIAKPVFDSASALAVDIVAGTTDLTMRDPIDNFPDTGWIRIDDEIIAYTSRDTVTRTFQSVSRGQLGSTAAAHTANTIANQTETVTDNPINIILRMLISNGGAGTYADLSDGLGISETLIDLAEIESIRDNLFSTREITLELCDIDSALKFIETEILQIFNLRFTYSTNAKLTLTVLDKAVFSPSVETIDEDTITTYPKWTVDDSKIVNQLKIYWDYDDLTGQFLRYSDLIDQDSIDVYQARTPLTFNFKGVKEDLDGDDIIAEFARVLFTRLSTPVAEVEVKTHIDRSLKNIGDKVFVESTKIPAPGGALNFSSDMEITRRAINHQQQEVTFAFAFTSFTKFRSGFICPSDLVTAVVTQKKIQVTTGRSAKYRTGWYMRLWNDLTQVYEADPPNLIVSIDVEESGGDVLLLESGDSLLAEDGTGLLLEESDAGADGDFITFADNWITTLTTNHRIRFAKYNDVDNTQKRYCFISDDGANFDDGKPTYEVTY